MKDWFKARNIWGAAITALSDEEAGRLAKAIWAYTMNGEIMEIEGAGKGILAMILLTLGQDAERDGEISVKRSMATAGIRSKKQLVDDIKNYQTISNDIKCNQMISNDANKNKNKNIDKEQEPESESFIGDDDARQIQSDHNRLLDAAEDAGFKMSNDVRASLIALYGVYGLSKVLDGYKACVKHGAVNLAYLEAVLKGKPKKEKAQVAAQDYEQRSYEDKVKDLAAEQDREMEEWLRGAG